MGCGTGPISGIVDFMGSNDPQNLPGQGLMRADNYNANTAMGEYTSLMNHYRAQTPQQLAHEREYLPQYTDLNLQTTGQANTGLGSLYGQNVGQEVGMLGQQAPQIRQALMANNPETARLLQLLNQQAEQDLMAGSRLNAEDQRYATQNSRRALAARGMSNSNQAIADEILQQYNLGQTRLNERRNFANQVVGLNTNVLQNPMLAYLAQSQNNAGARVGQASAFGQLGANALRNGPATQFLSSVYGENQSNNRATAANETQMALKGAEELSSAFGMMGGMCWAAREVFGVANPKWRQFRAWLLFKAPHKLRDWYVQNGAAWAARLKANPAAKPAVRRWMEKRIEKGFA